MLMPKRTKYRRPHRVSYEGKATRGTKVSFGEYGLQAVGKLVMPKRNIVVNTDQVQKKPELQGLWITSKQIEAARIAATRYMKRGGKVWINIFPQMAKTKKPLEVRMGSGKGSPEEFVAVVKKGRIMFEVAGVTEEVAREALRLAMHKLPIRCKIVKRGEE
ncbi:50S ribosomal protein L16 [Spiroplasma endosymbiont of 'Nebria riversi']|uniref:50S ribosomal protein L16 n=1 Tax=Spiroplasma endosymbiont of 'Nebria riversi' TaxID=2792084 RepID=UPI001C042607|nr:50S ribosomal protein L16 [Spiroplasma endosymbiont of 'Nebria riversi']